MSAQPIETRIARLEGTYEQINQRLSGIDQRIEGLEERIDHRIDSLEERMEQRFTGMEQRFTGMEQRFSGLERDIKKGFFWLVGIILTSMILPVAQRFVFH